MDYRFDAGAEHDLVEGRQGKGQQEGNRREKASR